MPSLLDDVSPSELGLPSKFTDFRRIQKEMYEFGLYGAGSTAAGLDELGERRVVAMGAPPGAGKSLFAHAIGVMSGMKYAVLTATRSLEDQQVSDGFDLVNIRGRANYECKERDPRDITAIWNCEEGDSEHGCQLSGSARCTYGERVDEAKRSRAILTNYAYWIHARSNNRQALEQKGKPIGMLICDEFHLAMNALAGFLGCWVGNEDLHKYANDEIRAVIKLSRGAEWGRVTKRWLDAIDSAYIRMITRMADIVAEYEDEQEASRESREYRRLKRLTVGLERIVSLGNDNNWLWRHTRNGIAFDCIWPGRYAERYLWSGVEKIILISATLRPKALGLMGLKARDYWFREWPRVFPAELNPVYWIPTGSMGKKACQAETGGYVPDGYIPRAQIERADEIYSEWCHLKGIVQTASFDRAQYLKDHSRYGEFMLLNKPGEATETAEKFRKMLAPCILV